MMKFCRRETHDSDARVNRFKIELNSINIESKVSAIVDGSHCDKDNVQLNGNG